MESDKPKMMTKAELDELRGTSNTNIAKALLGHIAALEQREAERRCPNCGKMIGP